MFCCCCCWLRWDEWRICHGFWTVQCCCFFFSLELSRFRVISCWPKLVFFCSLRFIMKPYIYFEYSKCSKNMVTLATVHTTHLRQKVGGKRSISLSLSLSLVLSWWFNSFVVWCFAPILLDSDCRSASLPEHLQPNCVRPTEYPRSAHSAPTPSAMALLHRSPDSPADDSWTCPGPCEPDAAATKHANHCTRHGRRAPGWRAAPGHRVGRARNHHRWQCPSVECRWRPSDSRWLARAV